MGDGSHEGVHGLISKILRRNLRAPINEWGDVAWAARTEPVSATASTIRIFLFKYTFDLAVTSKGRSEFGQVLHNPASLILIAYCLAVQGLVGSLAVYHCMLISRGVTTNESVRAR